MSKKMVIRAITLVSVLSLSSGVLAQPQEATEFNFDDDLVVGESASPLGETVKGERSKRRTSLIRVRNHFVPEMFKSVEQL